MHNRHHHYNHIHTLPLCVQSFALVDDLVLAFSSYKLCQNDAGFHTGSKSCERQDTWQFLACGRPHCHSEYISVGCHG